MFSAMMVIAVMTASAVTQSGAKIGGSLFSDALSDEKGPAASYIDMMRNNIRQLSIALTS